MGFFKRIGDRLRETREEKRKERARIDEIKRAARVEALEASANKIHDTIKNREVERLVKEATTTESKGAQIARKLKEGFAPTGAKLPDSDKIRGMIGGVGKSTGGNTAAGRTGAVDYSAKVDVMLGKPKKGTKSQI